MSLLFAGILASVCLLALTAITTDSSVTSAVLSDSETVSGTLSVESTNVERVTLVATETDADGSPQETNTTSTNETNTTATNETNTTSTNETNTTATNETN